MKYGFVWFSDTRVREVWYFAVQPWRGGGGGIGRWNLFALISPHFAIRIWPVNIYIFKYVHHGHFGILQMFLRFTVKYWHPWEVDGQSKCCQLLTHYGIFDPLLEKISTLLPLGFMFWYHMWKFQNKLYPPMDLMAFPLTGPNNHI